MKFQLFHQSAFPQPWPIPGENFMTPHILEKLWIAASPSDPPVAAVELASNIDPDRPGDLPPWGPQYGVTIRLTSHAPFTLAQASELESEISQPFQSLEDAEQHIRTLPLQLEDLQ